MTRPDYEAALWRRWPDAATFEFQAVVFIFLGKRANIAFAWRAKRCQNGQTIIAWVVIEMRSLLINRLRQRGTSEPTEVTLELDEARETNCGRSFSQLFDNEQGIKSRRNGDDSGRRAI